MTNIVNPEIGDILNKKYQITRRIGAGSFGAIYEVQDIETGKVLAVKLEKPNTPSPQLQYEHKIYGILDSATGVPSVYDFWSEDRWKGMVMDRLGNSLGYYFRKCGKILSMKTTLMVAIQMLSRLEYLHQRSFIHRDIKPDNFVFGVGSNSNLLYLIDLGLAKKYRDLRTHQHINYSEDRGLAGTARYVSINVHLGVEQSCRDDLESVGYVLVSLVKGKLPWQGMEACSKVEKYELISQSKMDTPLEVLCDGLPTEFLQYMQRVRALRFDEKPAYTVLRNLFINLMTKLNYSYDYQYDWVVSRAERLDGALRGTSDPSKVLIPISSVEIKGVTKKNPRNTPFMQPLPFFSVIHQAALFVGKSKAQLPDNLDLDQNNLKKKPFGEEQTMFILDPRKTKLPLGKQIIEFEFQRNISI